MPETFRESESDIRRAPFVSSSESSLMRADERTKIERQLLLSLIQLVAMCVGRQGVQCTGAVCLSIGFALVPFLPSYLLSLQY